MTHEELKAKAFFNAKVKQEYESLESEFALLRAVLMVNSFRLWRELKNMQKL